MIHISLFSGIGGFEIAAEWMGWRNLVSCDINEFGNKVRKHYWPEGYCHTDIKTLTYEKINSELSDRFGSGWRDDDIIITGGFPCQPYSSAGKRLGKNDERHLWPEMLRVISEFKPTYIVGENVRGLTNWNGGVVFEEVCVDLENLGYEVQPVLLPACSIGAPHRRDRIWFVAYSNGNEFRANQHREIRCENGTNQIERTQGVYNAFGSNGFEGPTTNPDCNGQHQCDSEHEIYRSEGGQHAFGDLEPSHGDGDASDTKRGCCERELQQKQKEGKFRGYNCKEFTADTCSFGLEGSIQTRINDQQRWDIQQGGKIGKYIFKNWSRIQFENFPTQSPICGGDDGLPTQLDGITFPKWRNESIKAYGNAIVPQVAYQIFKAL